MGPSAAGITLPQTFKFNFKLRQWSQSGGAGAQFEI